MVYRTILIDPPWPQRNIGAFTHGRNTRPGPLPYSVMSVDDIAALPITDLADTNCHLWLWTTNAFLRDGFTLMDGWGFKFLTPITWVKPSGMGAWFVTRTQTLLFGYKGRLDMKERYKPNVLFAPSRRHSQKPACSYDLVEAVSHEPRVELFARATRAGWTSVGDAIDGRDIRDAIGGA